MPDLMLGSLSSAEASKYRRMCFEGAIDSIFKKPLNDVSFDSDHIPFRKVSMITESSYQISVYSDMQIASW